MADRPPPPSPDAPNLDDIWIFPTPPAPASAAVIPAEEQPRWRPLRCRIGVPIVVPASGSDANALAERIRVVTHHVTTPRQVELDTCRWAICFDPHVLGAGQPPIHVQAGSPRGAVRMVALKDCRPGGPGGPGRIGGGWAWRDGWVPDAVWIITIRGASVSGITWIAGAEMPPMLVLESCALIPWRWMMQSWLAWREVWAGHGGSYCRLRGAWRSKRGPLPQLQYHPHLMPLDLAVFAARWYDGACRPGHVGAAPAAVSLIAGAPPPPPRWFPAPTNIAARGFGRSPRPCRPPRLRVHRNRAQGAAAAAQRDTQV